MIMNCKLFKPKMTNKWLFTIADIRDVDDCKLLEWCEEVWDVLKFGYTQPHRHYHNFGHIRTLLNIFGKYKSEFEDPLAVELAIWFHDVVYDPLSKFNEDASAELAFSVILKLQTVESIKLAKKVKELIMFTKWSDGGYLHIGTLYDLQKNFQYDSNDFFLFRDMDWSGFGLPWDKFQENGDNLRLEVPYLSDLEYTKRYLGFLNSLIEMHRPIYCSDIFNTKFESQANKNILKKIKILENFLKIS